MLKSNFFIGTTRGDFALPYLCGTGASFEKWIQIEFSNFLNYSLNQSKSISIYPEYQRFDITLCDSPEEIKGVIEIKQISNWYVNQKSLERIDSDIKKLKNYKENIEKVLLVFGIFAIPNKGKVRWMEQQLQNETLSTIYRSRFKDKLKEKFTSNNIIENEYDVFRTGKNHFFQEITLNWYAGIIE